MAVISGVVSVGASAVKLCTMGPSGALVQNQGAVVITLGGPNVTAGTGPTLAVSPSAAIIVPAGTVDPGAAETVAITDDLYAIGASAGPTNVAFLTNV
jgi:hypothetical protein